MLQAVCVVLSIAVASSMHIYPCEPHLSGPPNGCDYYMQTRGRGGISGVGSLGGISSVGRLGGVSSVGNLGGVSRVGSLGFGDFENSWDSGLNDNVFIDGVDNGFVGTGGIAAPGIIAGNIGSRALSGGKRLGLSRGIGLSNSIGLSSGFGGNFGLSSGIGKGLSSGINGGILGRSKIGGLRSVRSFPSRINLGGIRGVSRRGY